jgi:DNA-binding transcriptional LysR family regulator
VRLLDRSARGVRPTPPGEAFAHHARALLNLSARLADEMRAFAAGGRGSVRLHTTASAMTGHRLAEALADFAAQRPGIRVELHEATSLSVLQNLLETRADLGIVTSGGLVPEGLAARPWHEDRLLALVPAAHRFAPRDAVRFAEVLEEPLIGVLSGGALTLQLAREAERLGRNSPFRFQVQGTDAARHLVAAGHGVCVMPEGVVRPYEAPFGLRGVALAEPWARRRLSLVTRAEAAMAAPLRLLLEHLLHTATPDGVPPEDG